MQRSLIILGIAAVLGGLIYQGYYSYRHKYRPLSDTPVTLRFRYMQYACGDCYPQWNVDSVSEKKFYYLHNKDMKVFFQGKPLDDQLPEATAKCMICSRFYITGQVETTRDGKYKMIAETYKYTIDTFCCNN